MKNIFVITLLLISFGKIHAQNPLYGLSVGYQNQSGNMGKIGAFLLTANDEASRAYKLDANLNIAHFRNKTLLIPEVGVSLYPYNYGIAIPFVKAEATPYSITPKVGVSLATFLELGLGYDFSINDNVKPIKGINVSFNINIPLNVF